jgi:hypothetical protein
VLLLLGEITSTATIAVSDSLESRCTPVEMNSLFGQQGSWKGTSKITMMAIFEEQKNVPIYI